MFMSIVTICFSVCFTVEVAQPRMVHRGCEGSMFWKGAAEGGVFYKKTNFISLTNSETKLIALHIE